MDGLELTTFGVDGLREEILSRERAADERVTTAEMTMEIALIFSKV